MRRPTHYGGATSSRFYGVRWKGYFSRIHRGKADCVVCFLLSSAFPFKTGLLPAIQIQCKIVRSGTVNTENTEATAALLAQRIHFTSHLFSYVRSRLFSEGDGQGTFLQCMDRYTIWTSGSRSYWDEQNIFKGHKISDAKWTKRICKDSSIFECRCDIHFFFGLTGELYYEYCPLYLKQGCRFT